MTAGGANEDAWLAAALEQFGSSERIVLGPGHDVAAVRVEGLPATRGGIAILTKDVLVAGVHFDAGAPPRQIAYKALAVNLSDLAAAAARPVGFLIGAVLPRPPERALFEALMQGFAEAADTLGCPCLGGDTNTASGPLVLSITALGEPGPMGVLSRTGALVGDVLSVTGALGGSLSGRHLRPTPRVAEALALARAGVPHAMMDISDGLSRDVPRLCRSSGVGARLHAERIPIHPDARATHTRTPLERALHDGEDFELLLAHAALTAAQERQLAEAGVVLHAIGRILDASAGILLAEGGVDLPLLPRGYDHLSDATA